MKIRLHQYKPNFGNSPIYMVANDIQSVGYLDNPTMEGGTEVTLKGNTKIVVIDKVCEVVAKLAELLPNRWGDD